MKLFGEDAILSCNDRSKGSTLWHPQGGLVPSNRCFDLGICFVGLAEGNSSMQDHIGNSTDRFALDGEDLVDEPLPKPIKRAPREMTVRRYSCLITNALRVRSLPN